MITTRHEAAEALRAAARDPGVVPIHGPVHEEQEDGRLGLCVVGAIAYKGGHPRTWGSWANTLWDYAPVLKEKGRLLAGGDTFHDIVVLYEARGWTWEQIADWLDQEEV